MTKEKYELSYLDLSQEDQDELNAAYEQFAGTDLSTLDSYKALLSRSES